ncbi:MAG: GNAT family N-acetyltransferase [Vicinamibacterales bacterium]
MILTSVSASSPGGLVEQARMLVREYAALPHTPGRWPTAAAEIAALPHPYVPPMGALLLASAEGECLGCGALLGLDEAGCAEIKRVYVRPDARGRGVGELITRGLMVEAGRLGYAVVRLDTAPELTAAQALYRRLGFVPIPPYRGGLLPDALCFERRLATSV